MKWIKAKERLPELPIPLPPDAEDERGVLFVNRKHSCAFIWFPSYGHTAISVLEPMLKQGEGWELENWEYLDESLPGKEEGYINGLKELLRMAGCPELLIENPNMLKGQVEAVGHEWALKAIEKYKSRPYIDNAERQ